MDEGDMLRRLEHFFSKAYKSKLLESVQKENHIVVDFQKLDAFDPEMSDFLLETPEKFFKISMDAVSNIDLGVDSEKSPQVRISNLSESSIIRIRDVRSAHLNKLIAVEGIIKQTSEVRPEITEAKFVCSGCGEQFIIMQTKPTITKPFQCVSCGNRRGFELSSKTMIDVQRLVIEESPEKLGGGEQARKLAVFLRNDLVDPKFQKNVVPGNKVIATGVMKDIPMKFDIQGQETKRRDIYMDVSYLQTVEKEFEDVELTKEDLKEIKQFAKRPDIYDCFNKSIAPSIYGYENVKEAIVLQLFSGVQKKRTDGITLRGDTHILLVGDPGAAKSQLLRYVSSLAPKGRYIVGKSASGAGITAAAVKDEFTGGWALEAGALVLANGGLAAVDELDKMGSNDRSAMHEALEQQTVTVSKASIQATLPAKTIVLAAANPKFGRFNPYTSITEQINIPDTLLSRFDLIFTIRDIPHKDKDTQMAKHILRMHEKIETDDAPLKREFMRKYIAYARLNVKPKLTKEAKDAIAKFYVGLRNKYSGEETPSVPLSPRQLEALVRLSESSAKLRLSHKVLKEDAERAIRLLTFCLQQVGVDPETGRFDIDRLESGTTSTQRNKLLVVLKIISDLTEESPDKRASIDDIIAEAEEQGVEDAMDIIQKLKREGEIMEPRHGFIQKV